MFESSHTTSPFMKTKTKAKFRRVEVSWVDSEHNSDWSPLEAILEDQGSLECLSLGYLIADKEDRIILATSLTAAEDYEPLVSAYITIPKVCIVWMKDLRPVTVKKKIEQNPIP